jgi:lysophospholipase L1-like esterase
MVQLGSTADRTSMLDRILEFFHDPLKHKKTIAAVTFIMFTLLTISIHDMQKNNSVNVQDDHTFGVQISPRHRCFDKDDAKQQKHWHKPCQCTNPLRATKWNKRGWEDHHDELVRFAKQATQLPNTKLDVVMIGDSIIERWNGTRSMGQQLAADMIPVFEQHFTRHGGGRVDAIALGTSGDTSNNLLWHLGHGLLDISDLQPAVWFIMVGTNDIGRTGCSKRNTLAGILQVAQFLREKRPRAKIIIHGLLPRSDSKNDVVHVGRMWTQIQFINRELKKLCNLHDEWVYMESAPLFLRQAHGDTRAVEMNPETLPDGLHPSVKGYDLWSREIVKVVENLLER